MDMFICYSVCGWNTWANLWIAGGWYLCVSFTLSTHNYCAQTCRTIMHYSQIDASCLWRFARHQGYHRKIRKKGKLYIIYRFICIYTGPSLKVWKIIGQSPTYILFRASTSQGGHWGLEAMGPRRALGGNHNLLLKTIYFSASCRAAFFASDATTTLSTYTRKKFRIYFFRVHTSWADLL